MTVDTPKEVRPSGATTGLRDAVPAAQTHVKGPTFLSALFGRGARRYAFLLGFALAAVVLVAKVAGISGSFPDGVSLPLGQWSEQLTDWFIANLAWAYQPLTAVLDGLVAWMLYGLYVVPAPLLAICLVALAWRLAGIWVAALTAGTMILTVSFGLWEPMKETLALMTVAVLMASVAGIIVGVIGSMTPRLQGLVRVLLDAMQTYTMFAYLVPAIVIFGAGTTAALLVTVVWALPPVARMTIVGIRGVSAETVEAAVSQGVTRRQLWWKVLLPLALPSIRAGISQTIMFAMTMAIIASMIGAGGLGDPVWTRLRLLQFGPALEAGIVLVLLAIIVDRASSPPPVTGRASVSRDSRLVARWPLIGPVYRRGGFTFTALATAGFVLMLVVADSVLNLRNIDFNNPPGWLLTSLEGHVDGLIDWMNINYGSLFDGLSRTIQGYAINPAIGSLEWLPWPAILFGVFALGYVTLGWRGAVLVLGAVVLIGVLGMWAPAVYKFGFVAVAAGATVVVGVPIGVLASQSDRFAAIIRPVLDTMQTMPIFLFVIPSVVLLGPGPVAGLLATVAFAMPPLIRLTDVALRSTDPEIVEAAKIFGTTRWQMLSKVRFALGLPTLLVGLNQAVMLALAMAVVSAFIGTPGLGQQILLSISDADHALGVQAGVAMFLVAVVSDRIIHGCVWGFAPMDGQKRSTDPKLASNHPTVDVQEGEE